MSDVRTILKRGIGGATPPPDGFERMLRRRDRKRRNQRIAAAVVGVAVFVAAIWIVTTGGAVGRSQKPATTGGTGPSVEVPDTPGVDYIIDLTTGTTTRLPWTIIRSIGRGGLGRTFRSVGHYAASPDGSTLAYVGLGEEETPQIFIAGLDGTGGRQVTHEPTGATSPAWSPDGTMIAYTRISSTGRGHLAVLDLGTNETRDLDVVGRDPQFTPDGSTILYSGWTLKIPEVRSVPVAGGDGTVLIEPGPGLNEAGNGSISPDGTQVTYLGGGSPLAPDGSPLTFHGEEVLHAGPGRFVSNIDGSGFRLLPGFVSNPAGT